MSDAIYVPYPQRYIDPNEPGLLAGYTFADNELAQFGRYLNRAALGGAAYDLTTRINAPGIGYNGGIRGNAAAPFGSFMRGAVVPVGGTNFSYSLDHMQTTVAGGFLSLAVNGAANNHAFWTNGAGLLGITFAGGTTSQTTWSVVGRGVARYDALYDGVNELFVVNGLLVDQDAVVAVVPAGNLDIGQHGETTLYKAYSVRRTVAQARASYVREVAKRVIYQWAPRNVGEGPAGGILTGTHSGIGGYTCPLGAATMAFVWRPDLSVPGGGRLCLTDSAVAQMSRIDLEFGNRPFFGSWLIEYQVRNPATDSLCVGWTPRRTVDPTLAASNSYWIGCYNTGGGWWRTNVYLANGAAIDGADIAIGSVVAGSRCKALVTRTVAGDWQVYSWSSTGGNWNWTVATGNDVTVLSEGCLTVSPRGAYVERITWYQGEMTPHELEAL